MILAGFVFMDVFHSRAFLNRWKPQFSSDMGILSTTNVGDYIRARILLEVDSMGTLVSEDQTFLFVLGRESGQRVPIKCILSQDQLKIDACRALRQWTDERIIQCDATPLRGDDRLSWELSEFNA